MKQTLGLSIAAVSLIIGAPLHAQSTSSAPQHYEGPVLSIFKSPTVRVLLEHKSKGALVEVSGRYLVIDPKAQKNLSLGVFGKRFTVKAGDEGLSWGEEFPGVYQFKLIPRSQDRIFWVDGVQYSGVLYVYQIGDTISLVNEVEIENYVAAVTESNCEKTLHQEAANAMAICARSDAWYHVQTRPQAYWHIYAPDVGFYGIGGITESSQGSLAAKATKGLHLLSTKSGTESGLFLSRWTKHCAGQTVSYNQLNPDKKEKGEFSVDSSFARIDRERTQWQAIFSRHELESAFQLPRNSLQDVQVNKDLATQKVSSIFLKTDVETKVLSYFKVIQALGEDKVKSSDFFIRQLANQQYQFMGYGQGSGVGLCLYSADKMADKGQQAPQILEHFFPESKVEMVNFSK